MLAGAAIADMGRPAPRYRLERDTVAGPWLAETLAGVAQFPIGHLRVDGTGRH